MQELNKRAIHAVALDGKPESFKRGFNWPWCLPAVSSYHVIRYYMHSDCCLFSCLANEGRTRLVGISEVLFSAVVECMYREQLVYRWCVGRGFIPVACVWLVTAVCFIIAGSGPQRSILSIDDCYLVDPASSHMLVSKIKPCMSQYLLLQGETANGSLNQLWFTRSYSLHG